jgi:uncharacterized protein (TIGR02996 family)
MNDVDMMTNAVAANPTDATARLVLADAITERTGNYPAAVAHANRVAIEVRIAAFVAHLDSVMVRHWNDGGYTHSPPPTHRAEYISEKWCRIVRVDGGGTNGSVTAFVALVDNVTRTLGRVKAGDVHKPASYKVAAKHARGSVFADDFGKCVGPSGHVNYLR